MTALAWRGWLVALLLGAVFGNWISAAAQGSEEGGGQAGLVIVDGTGAVQNYCVDIEEGASGWDLLVDAGVAVNSEPSAMGNTICAINGVGCSSPRESCFCQCQGSPCVYWSLWQQNDAGEWIYSNQGASSARIEPGDVQGWVWGDGTSGKAPEPPAVTIGDICVDESLANAPAVGTMVTSAAVISASVISTVAASAPEVSTPAVVAQASSASQPAVESQNVELSTQGFPWTAVLVVLLPLPIILLVLLRKR